MHPYYDGADVITAAEAFLSAADRFRGVENYEYDLVDILRQAIAEKGRIVYHEMVDSLRAGSLTGFENAAGRFLALLDGQERLLQTRPEFKVGKWIADARALAADSLHADAMEENARLLVTTWGPRTASEKGGLRDYGHREWAGMMADFYRPRWEAWIAMQADRLRRGEAPVDTYADRFAKRAAMAIEADYSTGISWSDVGDSEIGCPIDFYEMDAKWVSSRKPYSVAPEGDVVATALSLRPLLK